MVHKELIELMHILVSDYLPDVPFNLSTMIPLIRSAIKANGGYSSDVCKRSVQTRILFFSDSAPDGCLKLTRV